MPPAEGIYNLWQHHSAALQAQAKTGEEILSQVRPVLNTFVSSPSPPSKGLSLSPPSFALGLQPDTNSMPHHTSQLRDEVEAGFDSYDLDEYLPEDPEDTVFQNGDQDKLEPTEEDEDKDLSTSLSVDKLINEATARSRSAVPEFCVQDTGVERVVVVFPNDNVTDITFQKWPGNTAYGYWLLADLETVLHIVHDLDDDGRYYAWRGMETRWDTHPIVTAWTSAMQQQRRVSSGTVGADSPTIERPARSLRKRNIISQHPYQADRIKHNATKAGRKVMDDSEVEEIIVSTQKGSKSKSKTKKTAASTKTGRGITRSGSRRSFSTAFDDGSPSPPDTSIAEEGVKQHTTFRTRLDGFTNATVPVFLRNIGALHELLDAIREAWEWQLGTGKVHYCIAKFPWLGEDANVLFRDGMHDSYTEIIDEIGRAPNWKKKGGKCDVDVVVYATR